MRTKSILGNLTLLITAFVWGLAFVAQTVGNGVVGPFTFQASRYILGGIVLLPVIFITDSVAKRNGTYKKQTKADNRLLLKSGIICGVVLSISTAFQQVGLNYTTVGKAGFITALYVIIVPILGIFIKKKVHPRIWFCVAISMVGLYLLCMGSGENFSLSYGDILMFGCALGCSFHIMVVDHYSPFVNGIKLSCIQFFAAGLTSAIPMFIFENPQISSIIEAAVPIMYAGMISCGIGYTLQIVGQKYTKPAIASMLMSLESVFATLSGAVLLSQIPTPREAIGCVIMFAAIIIAQLPLKEVNG